MSLVCVGAIVGVHGVRGAVRIKSFTAIPEDICSYGMVQSEDGTKRYDVRLIGEAKGLLIAKLSNVVDRNQAEALKGTQLFVSRDALPELEEDEFLYSDLVGLDVFDGSDQRLGKIRGVSDFGAGEVLDIVSPSGNFMIPFTKADVPVVDIKAKRVVVVPPTYMESDEEEEKALGRDDE